MWIYFAGGSFLSIVQDSRPGYLLVRSRSKGSIESIFKEVTVTEGCGSDYLFRSSVPVDEVGDAIARQIKAGIINYTNYKGSISNRKTHDTLFKVWLISKELETPECPA